MSEVKTPWKDYMGDVPMHLEYFQGTMFEAVENIAHAYPNNIAFTFMGRSTTYRRMVQEVERCAKSLKVLGIRPGDKVTIAMPNCPQAIFMFYAVNLVGGIANKSIVQTHLFYLNLMDDIYSTYRAVQPGETPFPFTDVPESRWSYPYIKQLYDAGVVSGMTATTFDPAANMTRAQFVTMLAGLQGADVSAYRTGKFTDVPADAWYAPYVNWALANGIVSGTSAVTFSPDASITRQDMAVMLYQYTQRYDVALQQQTVTPFMDESSISAYALPAVQALHRAGVISGMPDGSFQPFGTATREQACVVLCTL